MKRSGWVSTSALALLLGAALPAAAASVPVKDAGRFFSAEAVVKADALLKEIDAKRQRVVLVETIDAVPADKKDAVAKMDGKERAKYFGDLAIASGKAAKADVVVFACKEPAHLRVLVGGSLTKAGYSKADETALKDKVLAAFKEKKFDVGLLDGLAFLNDSLGLVGKTPAAKTAAAVPGAAKPAAPAAAVPPAGNPGDLGAASPIWGWLIIGGVVLLGLWLVMGLMRAMSGAGGGMGGGGMLGGLMAGMFGAMAGSWLYNSFFTDNAFGGDPG
ncbi:MAG: hypothetical protein ACRDD1_22280, partial [Planctomycetia bacterium]